MSVYLLKVLLVGETRLLRTALRAILESRDWPTEEACSALHALEKLREWECEVVLSELEMADHDGAWLTQEIRKEWPNLPVLLLSQEQNHDRLATAFLSGANGYISPEATGRQLEVALLAISHGGFYLHTRGDLELIIGSLRSRVRDQPALDVRETTILKGLMAGQSNGEIAASLGLSVSRIKDLLKVLIEKFGAKDRITLAVAAAQTGAPHESALQSVQMDTQNGLIGSGMLMP